MNDPKYYFIDESGSPDFYGKRKKLVMDQPLLILGMISTLDRDKLNKQVRAFQKELLGNSELKGIRSLHKPNWFLHARVDHVAVLTRFFNFLSTLDFKIYAVIGRKDLDRFEQKHHSNASEFYYDLVKYLIKYRFRYDHKSEFYLSKGQKQSSKSTFVKSVANALEMYAVIKKGVKRKYTCEFVDAKECPELSVVDYATWALQKYILDRDATYFNLLKDKYLHIYDTYAKGNPPIRHYHKDRRFTLTQFDKAGKIQRKK